MVLHYGGESVPFCPCSRYQPASTLKCRIQRSVELLLTSMSRRIDLTDTTNLVYIVSSVQPTEIYNLAAQSHVKVSFDMAEYTVRYLSLEPILITLLC